jgi:phenylacetate-coenzyme A ligase PaaK-like adenylate-forming protein
VFNIAGTTELGTVNMFECPTAPGHCHIIESGVIEEVLHPQTKQPVDYGELGVRVCTGIGREGMQLFRHWTEDLVIKRPWHECGCGRTWDWFEGGIIGRADDMRKVRGILVTPVMIEDVMRGFPEVAEFRTVLRTIRGLDTIFLQIEPRTGGAADSGDLGDRISAAVKSEIGLRPEVEIVEPGALPRFDLKAVRFHDEREG